MPAHLATVSPRHAGIVALAGELFAYFALMRVVCTKFVTFARQIQRFS
jgi:hypothetical protein